MREVYISLTTVPTRTDILKKCLDSLIEQSYPVKSIILTIPARTLRTGVKTVIPDYLYEYPYNEKVTIVNPKKDYGPIMKYIGGYKHITRNSLVFVCDDDQQYHRNLVKKLVNMYDDKMKLDNNFIVTASGYKLLTTDVVWGYGSLLLPRDIIRVIRNSVIRASDYVKRSCQLVDDNWVSIILKKNGIKIYNMGIGDEKFSNGKMLCPTDGLSQTTNRMKDIAVCTYAIDHENTYPIVALILFILFIIIIIVNYYWISYL